MFKDLIQTFVASILCLCAISLAAGQQSSIAPEKKALIAEMISVTNADQQVEDAMRAIFDQMDSGYPVMVDQLIEKKYPDITPSQRKEVTGILLRQNTGEQSFRNRMMAAIDFHDYVEKSVYPLYDKFFTESELSDLLAFYKTPTGKKTIQVMPQLLGESVRLAQEILLPKIIAVSDQAIENDIAKARESLSKKPVKN